MARINVSTGTTVTFGTSGFSADIKSISLPNCTRENVNTSHMGTTNAHTFVPTDLLDWGEFGFDIIFDPESANVPPLKGDAESITVTFPDSAAHTWVFSAFVTGFSANMDLEGQAEGTVTMKVTGDVTLG